MPAMGVRKVSLLARSSFRWSTGDTESRLCLEPRVQLRRYSLGWSNNSLSPFFLLCSPAHSLLPQPLHYDVCAAREPAHLTAWRKTNPPEEKKNVFSTVLGSWTCSSPEAKTCKMVGRGGIFFKIQNFVKLHPSKSALLWSYLLQSLTDRSWNTSRTGTGPGLVKWYPVLESWSLQNLRKRKTSHSHSSCRTGGTEHGPSSFLRPKGYELAFFNAQVNAQAQTGCKAWRHGELTHLDSMITLYKQWNVHCIRDWKPSLKLFCFRIVSLSDFTIADPLNNLLSHITWNSFSTKNQNHGFYI